MFHVLAKGPTTRITEPDGEGGFIVFGTFDLNEHVRPYDLIVVAAGGYKVWPTEDNLAFPSYLTWVGMGMFLNNDFSVLYSENMPMLGVFRITSIPETRQIRFPRFDTGYCLVIRSGDWRYYYSYASSWAKHPEPLRAETACDIVETGKYNDNPGIRPLSTDLVRKVVFWRSYGYQSHPQYCSSPGSGAGCLNGSMGAVEVGAASATGKDWSLGYMVSDGGSVYVPPNSQLLLDATMPGVGGATINADTLEIWSEDSLSGNPDSPLYNDTVKEGAITVSGCHFDYAEDCGIWVDGCVDAVVIRDCIIERSDAEGIRLDYSDYITVTGCEIKNNHTGGVTLTNTHYATINGCVFAANTNEGEEGHSHVLVDEGSVGVSVTNNRFLLNNWLHRAGVEVGVDCLYTVIAYNEFRSVVTSIIDNGDETTAAWNIPDDVGSGGGSGDMTKAVYDADGNGVVDQAESVPWAGITDAPATFPPESHAHAAADITDLPPIPAGLDDLADVDVATVTDGQLLAWDEAAGNWVPVDPGVGSGDMAKATYDLNDNGVVDAAESVPWSGVTDAPATFPPEAHSHTVTDISDFPTEFPPEAHTHSVADITDFPAIPANLDDLADVSAAAPSNGQVLSYDDGTGAWVAADPATGGATAIDDLSDVDTTGVADGQFLQWDEAGGNWVPGTPSGAGDMLISVYDTNGNNIVDAAESVPWAGITDAPTEFPPEAHTHALADLSDVDVTGVTDGYTLVYAAGEWVAVEPTVTPGSTVDISQLHEHAYSEDHSGECNGSLTTVILANEFSPGTTQVWLNGLRQRPGRDYDEIGYDSIEFSTAPLAGDDLLIDYEVV